MVHGRRFAASLMGDGLNSRHEVGDNASREAGGHAVSYSADEQLTLTLFDRAAEALMVVNQRLCKMSSVGSQGHGVTGLAWDAC